MDNNELLLAMSAMLDTKLESALQPIKDDIQNMKSEIQDMKSEIQDMKSEIQRIDLRLKRVEVDLLENNVIPRLNTIEDCYLTTYKRYKGSIDGYESMQFDIDVLKTVVAGHSEKLQKLQRRYLRLNTKSATK